MKDLDKIRVMLPHWIEHNDGHGAEFLEWTEKLRDDSEEIADLLQNAARSLQEAKQYLEEALTKAGGPLEGPNHHHHH